MWEDILFSKSNCTVLSITVWHVKSVYALTQHKCYIKVITISFLSWAHMMLQSPRNHLNPSHKFIKSYWNVTPALPQPPLPLPQARIYMNTAVA